MSNTYVWIAQCLCPRRHCILAAADEATSAAEADSALTEGLRQTVALMLLKQVINPWCDLCGSPSDTWQYELGRTPYTSIAEAMPHLEASERAQQESKHLLRRSQN